VKRLTALVMALAFAGMWAVMAAGIPAVRLTREVRVVGLVILLTSVVAALLVLYFDWRTKLQRRILADRDERPVLADPSRAAAPGC
jgi:hypothetical protein